jgi:lipopolysaccharide transport system permease protein
MATEPYRTLRPSTGWVAIEFRELVRYADLLVELARRDVKLRYRQTFLGIAWVILQPLVAAGALTFAFGVVAGLKPEGTPSAFLFTYAGLLAWNAFAWTLSKTSLSMVGNSYLVSKVYFPRLILPLSGTLSTLLDMGVSFLLWLVLMAVHGVWPGWAFLLLPVWIVLVLCFALGLGLVAAALTVEYRDIQHILPVLIPFMLYASPVAYDVRQIPAAYQQLAYLLNPLTGLITSFRWSLLGTPPAPLPYVIWSAAISITLFMFGAAVFRRTERNFADVL